MIILLLGLLSPLLLGFLLVRLLAPGTGAALQASLGIGLGAGLVSVLCFLALLIGVPPLGVEILALVGLTAFWLRRRTDTAPAPLDARWTVMDRALCCAFALTGVAAVFGFEAFVFGLPHGWWDAWAMWNTKARFLATSGWRGEYSLHMYRIHPDYPLLVPAFIARIWRATGGRELAASQLAGFLFTFATAGVLASSLVMLKGRSQGFLAGILLLATPFFTSLGASQYADVPEGFFVLAVIVLSTLADEFRPAQPGLTVLLGLSVGMAAWTKNEGWVLVVAFGVVRALRLLRARDREAAARYLTLLAAGLAPMLMIALYFKKVLAPPNWSIEFRPEKIAQLAVDPIRYQVLRDGLLGSLTDFGGHRLVSLLTAFPAYALCAGIDTRTGGRYTSAVRTASGTLALVFAGYLASIIIAPFDIHWQVSTALYRLMMQLFPAALFTGFLALRSPADLLASFSGGKQSREEAPIETKPIEPASTEEESGV